MDIKLIEVPLSDRRLLRRFIDVPRYIHREHWPNPHWVPPLSLERKMFFDPAKHPVWRHLHARLWIANDGLRDVGRVSAVIDRDHLAHNDETCGFLGTFECPDNPALARLLCETAESWLVAQGMTKIIGPTAMNSNYEWGCMVEGFDREPGINMPYNPPYYAGLLEHCGYTKAKDLYQWGFDVQTPTPPRIARIAERVKTRDNISIRELALDRWGEEVRVAHEIYNEAWQQNWGFIPLDDEEWNHIADDLKLALEPSLGLVAEVQGRPVGIALSVKNLNPILKQMDGRLLPFGLLRMLWELKVKKSVNAGRLVLLGIRPEYRRRGLDVLLMVETHRAAQKLGYEFGELGWTLEDNDSINKPIQMFGATRVSTYRVFEKELSSP